MNLPLFYYVLGTPLGVLGLIRWGAWLIRRIPAVMYQPIAGEHRASLAIVVPVYARVTIRRQRWGTRQVAVENGQVVRTGPGVPPGVAVLIPEQNAERMRVPA